MLVSADMQTQKEKSFTLSLGTFMTLWYAVLLAFSMVMYCFNVTASQYHLIVSMFISALSFRLLFPETTPKRLTAILLASAAILCAWVLVSIGIWDTSWDGQACQLEGYLAIANGWNPIKEVNKLDMCGPFVNEIYTKGTWINSAAIYKLAGYFEAGKAWNGFMLTASFLIVFSFVSGLLNVSRFRLAICSLLVSLCPVVCAQLFTRYVDGLLFSMILILICGLGLFIAGVRRPGLTVVFSSLAVIPSIKMPGIFFMVYIGIWSIAFAWVINRRFDWKFYLACVLFSAFSILFFGYNPYINNAAKYGNPVHPVMDTKSATTIVGGQILASYAQKPTWKILAISLLAETGNQVAEPPRLKYPFTLSRAELYASVFPDTRFGGLGVFFSGILILSLILFVLMMAFAGPEGVARRKLVCLLLFLGALVLLAVVHPGSWWARYAPYIWLLPASVILFSLYFKSRLVAFARILLVLLVMADLGVLEYCRTPFQIRETRRYASNLKAIGELEKQNDLTFYSDNFKPLKVRLSEKSIGFHEADKDPKCPNGIEVFSGTIVCPVSKAPGRY